MGNLLRKRRVTYINTNNFYVLYINTYSEFLVLFSFHLIISHFFVHFVTDFRATNAKFWLLLVFLSGILWGFSWLILAPSFFHITRVPKNLPTDGALQEISSLDGATFDSFYYRFLLTTRVFECHLLVVLLINISAIYLLWYHLQFSISTSLSTNLH